MIALVPATREKLEYEDKLEYLEIEVDGKRLAHHFAGRLGSHPSHLSPIGWSTWKAKGRASVLRELLGDQASELESGRVAVLVCEMCGDVGCWGFTVRILREGDLVRWTDWVYEDGYEPPEDLDWPTRPGDFVFDRRSYEAVLREHLQPAPSSWVSRLLAMLGNRR